MSEIYVVVMPFGPLRFPPLAVGQLVAAARNAGMDAAGWYLPFRFGKIIGYEWYTMLAESVNVNTLLSEWCFSKTIFDRVAGFTYDAHFPEKFLQTPMGCTLTSTLKMEPDSFIEKINLISDIATQFVEETAREIVAGQPRIVGCSATFQQYTASLALLHKIKELDPAIVTMLGGATCEGEMGLVTIKNFRWVDYLVSGEADTLFPTLCRNVFEHGMDIPIEDIPYGVYTHKKLATALTRQNTTFADAIEVAKEIDINHIPIPEFDWYFAELKKASPNHAFSTMLAMETSRGCWKGQVQPCNFCGLNGKRIQYRTKTPDRVLQELAQLSETYGTKLFMMTDTILNLKYFETIFKELIRKNTPYHLFFETTSMLTEQQLTLLADAGVFCIQPGIESLHDDLLRLLNKGNSAIHNLALLKYTLEQGIYTSWNILVNIPGDDATWYQEMIDLLPLCFHLCPPNIPMPIRYDRFSQYYQNPTQFGLKLSPCQAYQMIYPFTQQDLEHFAYFFQNEDVANEPKFSALQRLSQGAREWNRYFWENSNGKRAKLQMVDDGEQLVIQDTRPCAVAAKFVLVGMEREIYRACRKPVTKEELSQSIDAADAGEDSDQRVEANIQVLLKKKLLIEIRGRYLALAAFPPKAELLPIFQKIRSLSHRTQSQSPTKDAAWHWLNSL